MGLEQVIFVVKFFAIGIWFFLNVCYGFVLIFYRLRNASAGYYIGRPFGFGLFYILGLKIKVLDRENIFKRKGVIFASNHQSALDLAFCPSVVPKDTVCIAKKSFLVIPVFGMMWWLANQIFIDRTDRNKAINTLDVAAKRIKEKKHSVWIFPEGTRNWLRMDTPLLEFKKGAFHMSIKDNIPIIPVVISPLNEVIDMDKKKINTGKTMWIKVLPLMEPPANTNKKEENDENCTKYIKSINSIMVQTLEELKEKVRQRDEIVIPSVLKNIKEARTSSGMSCNTV